MTSSLPSVLTTAELPSPELQAAVLDGDVFALDRAFCSIAEFDVPWRRAMAISGRVAPAAVVVRCSAAWVWGALVEPPWEVELLSHGTRVRSSQGEIVDFGPVRVTTPVRTLTDLARSDRWADGASAVARRLFELHPVTREECERVLTRSPHLPYRRRADERLDELGVQ